MLVTLLSGSAPNGLNALSSKWKLEFSDTFLENYLGKSSEDQHRVEDALTTLAASDWPNRLGEVKDLPPAYGGRVIVYDISRSSRLSYNVLFDDKTISCVRVCNHQTVQGRKVRD
jgi:hypothetical protein